MIGRIPRQAAVARNLVFTKYLNERDCLTASFTRLGSGFTPPSVLAEAKHHLETINALYAQMEKIVLEPKETSGGPPLEFRPQRGCCGD